jgi:hypothetical protein
MAPTLIQLQQHFEVLRDLYIDCDGKSQLIHTVLELSGIPHTCYGGKVQFQETIVTPHFWVVLALEQQPFLVDYSLHQWLPDGLDIPCGIFQAHLYPLVQYVGEPVILPILPEPLFLTTQLDPRHEQILAYVPLPQLTP